MKQDVIMCSAVCSFAPHQQATVEAIPHFCISKQKLDLYRFGKAKSQWHQADIFNKCMELRGVFLPLMLHFYSAYHVTLASDWAGSVNSSNAARTNGCLDLSCHNCPPSGDRSLSYKRCSGS